MIFGSMALLADGVHMATHAGALTIAALAYQYARTSSARLAVCVRHRQGRAISRDSRARWGWAWWPFSLPWSRSGGCSIRWPSRLDDAILVAVVGLIVNLVSAALLMHPHGDEGHSHGHDHGARPWRACCEAAAHDDHDHAGHDHDDDHASHDHHDHDHDDPAHRAHDHVDHNLLAAYVHVLADAFTSVLAIVALVAGRYFGWVWLDAAMGIVGALVILRWSYGLARQTARVLLDSADPQLIRRVKERLERDGACVSDLHVWRLGPGHSAVVATVVCPAGNPPDHFKEKLEQVPTLSHVTVEVLDPREPDPRRSASRVIDSRASCVRSSAANNVSGSSARC